MPATLAPRREFGMVLNHLVKRSWIMTAPGAFHWNELQSRNIKKAKDFYAKTLGWKYEDMPMGDDMYGTYTIIKANGEQVGGMFEMKGPMFEGVPETWFSYVAVKDVDAAVKK